MATKTAFVSVCLLFLAVFSAVQSFMDMEELRSITYGINIVKEPIIIPETPPETAITVTSRHGQRYQCDYPSHHQQRQQQEEEEKIALETGVVELLKPLASQPCLIKIKDWWTYEFCYGKHIRQFHAEDGRPKGDIMFLGHYQSDFDWNNETLREARVRSKLASGRYHSQYYTNGSKCDLTGNGRQTEIRFLCENLEDDYIVRVDEPETCVYVITVHTHRLCSHPHLKSPTPTQPIPIICQPLLTNHQYTVYQAHTQAMKKKEEEALAKAKAQLEQKEREQAEAAAEKEDDSIEDDLTGSVNTILKKSLGKELKEKIRMGDEQSTEPGSDPPKGWKWTDVKELDNLDNLMDPQGILSNMDMSHKGQMEKPSKPVPEQKKAASSGTGQTVIMEQEDASRKKEEEEEEEETETALDEAIDSALGDFDREVKVLREKQAMTHKRLQQIKDRVKKTVTSQFKDIIDEAQAELGGEMNEALALNQLSDSLNGLMGKLEDTEKEIKDMDKEIKDIAERSEVKDAIAELKVKAKEEEGSKGGVQAPPNTRQGVKVHVKIISSTSSNSDDDEVFRVMSDEDTASFQNMIVAILGGSTDAVKEQKRQSSLEDNYNFIFDENIGENTDGNTGHSSQTGSDDTSDDDGKVSTDEAPTLTEQGL
ncbi:protein OS-9-like isoform X2 [Littorina saxatilis]|uniref:protein OS-9-like isoform X2 n=1 Tax=Littorina saxatilis TaxID=31220 RepID=UPI0038B5EA4C